MPDFPPAVEIEGDYSDYTVKWDSLALSIDVDNPVHVSCFNTDETMFIYADVSNVVTTLQVSDGIILTEDAGFARGFTANQYADKSVYGKYMASINNAEDTLRIWKDGVLLKTITPVDPNDVFYGAYVSKSGLYIALAYWDDSDGNNRMRCYEGV